MVYYWHIHHEVIAEPTDDIEERKEYVRKYKHANEVETRLRLMTPVKAQDTVGKAWKEYNAIWGKARKEYEAIEGKAFEEYEAIVDGKAYEEYEATDVKAYGEYAEITGNAYSEYESIRDKAWDDYIAKLEDLHKKEHPDCPWNGKTIFPEEED